MENEPSVRTLPKDLNPAQNYPTHPGLLKKFDDHVMSGNGAGANALGSAVTGSVGRSEEMLRKMTRGSP